jgi:aconitate hydratase
VSRFGFTIERDGFIMNLKMWAAWCWPMHVVPVSVSGQDILMIQTARTPFVTSYNRNFAKRNDGLSSTHAFVGSPELVTALAMAGTLSFNPLKDKLKNAKGEEVMLKEPTGFELPPKGFDVGDAGYQAPAADGSKSIRCGKT